MNGKVSNGVVPSFISFLFSCSKQINHVWLQHKKNVYLFANILRGKHFFFLTKCIDKITITKLKLLSNFYKTNSNNVSLQMIPFMLALPKMYELKCTACIE